MLILDMQAASQVKMPCVVHFKTRRASAYAEIM